MEIKAELKQPYSNKERMEFIVNQNHNNGYEIHENNGSLQAWGYTEEEIFTTAKEHKYQEALQGARDFINNNAYYRYDENNTIEATDGNIGKLTAYALGLQSGMAQTVTWTSKEDNVLTLNAEAVTKILTGLGAIQTDIWNNQYITFKDQIEKAKTLDDLNGVYITYNSKVQE